MIPPSNYEIRLSTSTSPADDELEQLLSRIYVDGGFTAAKAVRARGTLLVSIESKTQTPVGLVIVVPPDSPASEFAAADETEMHLLGVLDEHRGAKLGHGLVEAAMEHARLGGYARMLLWTQPAMKPAHSLYNKMGFVHDPTRDFSRGDDEEFLFMHVEL